MINKPPNFSSHRPYPNFSPRMKLKHSNSIKKNLIFLISECDQRFIRFAETHPHPQTNNISLKINLSLFQHTGRSPERYVPRAESRQSGWWVAAVRLHVPRGTAPASRARLHQLRSPRHASRVSINPVHSNHPTSCTPSDAPHRRTRLCAR